MTESLLADTTISHYRILSRIGAGGMGEVYLAEDTKLDGRVALKLLPAEFTTQGDRLGRFLQEAKAAAALSHPNVAHIYEVNESAGWHFIAMEYIEGETLRHRLAHRKLSLPEALEVAMQVVNALASAHAAGVVHRDIKPENIMLRSDSYVKVLDFGLAKLTEKPRASATDSEMATVARVDTDPGTVMGTSRYMSPEQARGKPVDARSDIFSLGIVLYEMIAGQPPFQGETTGDVIVALLDREPLALTRASPETPAELQRIVSKALRKDKEERAISLNPNYPTARHWYQILLGALGRDDEALAEIKRALELDPLSPVLEVNIGLLYIRKGDLDSAMEHAKRLVQLDPNFPLAHAGVRLARKGFPGSQRHIEFRDNGCDLRPSPQRPALRRPVTADGTQTVSESNRGTR